MNHVLLKLSKKRKVFYFRKWLPRRKRNYNSLSSEALEKMQIDTGLTVMYMEGSFHCPSSFQLRHMK